MKMRMYNTRRPYFERSESPKVSAQNKVQNIYIRYIVASSHGQVKKIADGFARGKEKEPENKNRITSRDKVLF
jgi:hypothetical protein